MKGIIGWKCIESKSKEKTFSFNTLQLSRSCRLNSFEHLSSVQLVPSLNFPLETTARYFSSPHADSQDPEPERDVLDRKNWIGLLVDSTNEFQLLFLMVCYPGRWTLGIYTHIVGHSTVWGHNTTTELSTAQHVFIQKTHSHLSSQFYLWLCPGLSLWPYQVYPISISCPLSFLSISATYTLSRISPLAWIASVMY